MTSQSHHNTRCRPPWRSAICSLAPSQAPSEGRGKPPSDLGRPLATLSLRHHDVSANLRIRKPDGYNHIVQNKSMCTQGSTPWSLVLGPVPGPRPWNQIKPTWCQCQLTSDVVSTDTQRKHSRHPRPARSILVCRGLADRSSLQNTKRPEHPGSTCLRLIPILGINMPGFVLFAY